MLSTEKINVRSMRQMYVPSWGPHHRYVSYTNVSTTDYSAQKNSKMSSKSKALISLTRLQSRIWKSEIDVMCISNTRSNINSWRRISWLSPVMDFYVFSFRWRTCTFTVVTSSVIQENDALIHDHLSSQINLVSDDMTKYDTYRSDVDTPQWRKNELVDNLLITQIHQRTYHSKILAKRRQKILLQRSSVFEQRTPLTTQYFKAIILMLTWY